MYVYRNNEARSRIIVAVEKQQVLLIGLCVCVRAFVHMGIRASGCVHAYAYKCM